MENVRLITNYLLSLVVGFSTFIGYLFSWNKDKGFLFNIVDLFNIELAFLVLFLYIGINILISIMQFLANQQQDY